MLTAGDEIQSKSSSQGFFVNQVFDISILLSVCASVSLGFYIYLLYILKLTVARYKVIMLG